jgi:hypothetical protein
MRSAADSSVFQLDDVVRVSEADSERIAVEAEQLEQRHEKRADDESLEE